jgi:hypothetical protein
MPSVTLHSGKRITGIKTFMLLAVTAPLWILGILFGKYSKI